MNFSGREAGVCMFWGCSILASLREAFWASKLVETPKSLESGSILMN